MESLEIYDQYSQSKPIKSLPLIINGRQLNCQRSQMGISPETSQPFYRYSLAGASEIEKCLKTAKQASQEIAFENWSERADKLLQVANLLSEKRFEFIALIMLDVAKSSIEADGEVSEAIDFCEYYARSIASWQDKSKLKWQAIGTVLVCSPWNFPLAIPTGGLAAALITGNTCIFKPAPESTLVGYELVKVFYQAGFTKRELQFVSCEDEFEGTSLIQDPRINAVVLTGATETAQLFLKLRPDLNLLAETGGKNTMIISELSDRDLAIKHLVDSAFAFSGQKCSACSLALIHKSLYEDPKFLATLKDTVQSRFVGVARDQGSFITPLIQPPQGKLLRTLTELEEGESWLLEPKINDLNPQLVSPGIKMGIKSGSVSATTEFFGPVLALMPYEDLNEAIDLVNSSECGLTGGIHSLDEREQKLYLDKIQVGNAYVCRGITGAMVQRQAFGGYKNSSFGRGLKAGGPNYLLQFCQITESNHKENTLEIVLECDDLLKAVQLYLGEEDFSFWYDSCLSYRKAYADHFSQNHDEQNLIGQANIFRYRPVNCLHFIIQPELTKLDIVRVLTAAKIAGVKKLRLFTHSAQSKDLLSLQNVFEFKICESGDFSELLDLGARGRVRLIQPASKTLQQEAADKLIHLQACPVYSEGRLELLHYFYSQSLSIDYHRYGNVNQPYSL